ncbi:hypothetical protein [Pedobacter foliorum]|uniref:hypothetical protein n=2 Tax=Pedobacter foliorum TaxID=2739058 RepID=UPI0037CCB5A2|nr:hypothetical protein [Pedobacter foliorum]
MIRLISISNWHLCIKNQRIHLGGLVLLLFVGHFIYKTTVTTMENYQLSNNGEICKAMVVSRMKVGGKGTIRVDYRFNVNYKEYSGVVNNEEYYNGDSINILYLEKSPEINRSYNFIKENYKTQIIP